MARPGPQAVCIVCIGDDDACAADQVPRATVWATCWILIDDGGQGHRCLQALLDRQCPAGCLALQHMVHKYFRASILSIVGESDAVRVSLLADRPANGFAA